MASNLSNPELGPAVDAEHVRDRVRVRADRIRRAELATAMSRLEANGGLTPAQRAAVEAMATSLTTGVMPLSERVWDGVDDSAELAAIVRLFDLDC